MRQLLLEQIKKEISEKLSTYLGDEGITFYISANDNISLNTIAVVLEEIYSLPLSSSPKLISEIQIILGVLGKPWQCEKIIDGIYYCLCPHRLTLPELTVLLMSMHVETVRHSQTKRKYKKTMMRYIVEEEIV